MDGPVDPKKSEATAQGSADPTAPGAVIIGAGVLGCSIALELARRGYRPVVVDKGQAAGGGSTSSSSAIIRFHYSTADAVALAWESAQHWLHWEDALGLVDPAGMARFLQTGILVLEQPDAPSTKSFNLFDQAKVPYRILDTEELAEMFPAIDVGRHQPPKPVDDPKFWDEPHGTLRGYITPDAGFVDDPALAAHNLMIAAEAVGATFRFRSEVVGVHSVDGVVQSVELATGEILSAPIVVNAAGPHSSHINQLAGAMRDSVLTTRPLRQEVHVVPAPADFVIENGGMAVSDTDLGTYFKPNPGGTLTVGGVEPECDPLIWIEDADEFDPNPTVGVWEAQTLRLARRLPEVGLPNRPVGLAAVYDVSTDWLPIYDRTEIDGFYVAIGTSGNQFKNAPMVGPLMGELIEAVQNGRDHDHDPLVITGPKTGLPINVGSFSRLRTPQNTTNSVLG